MSNAIKLPFSSTARKYGYIIWKKKDDDLVKEFLGNRKSIDLQFSNYIQRKKTIDWSKRRVGVTYTLTRNIPSSAKYISLQWKNKNRLEVSFK